MQLFKAAGGNCLATYVPWLIHEPEEGRFSFGGKGPLDLEGFLQTAAEEGLYVIARPGPYQYSELKYDGLPGWLCEGYPALRAQTLDGKAFRTASLSYLHPLFLDKVRRWFAEVCPRLARHTVTKGGPVAYVQFDNELAGIHVWFGSLDYNPTTMGFGQPDGRWPRFLQARYGAIAALNRLYGSSFAGFSDVRPLAPAPAAKPAEIRRMRDYFQFYLQTIAEYGCTLAAMMREFGIDVPFVHNSANPQMNAWFKPLVEHLKEPFVLGSDHYYNLNQDWPQNNPTPQYTVGIFTSLEMLRLMGYPPTVHELPGGSGSDWPPVTPGDGRTCYLTNVAFGMKGSNFYILTGGPNRPGTGVTSDVYDYGASIGARGEIRPLYKTQKEVGLTLKKNAWLMEAGREFDCRVTLDFEHPVAKQYWQTRGDFLLSSAEAWTFTQRGFLTTSLCAGLSPAMVDLDQDDWVADTATPLVVVASASMAREKQERVVRFLRNGGRALLGPVIPTHDEHLAPCQVLSDYLGGPIVTRNPAQFSRVTVSEVVNVLNNGDVYFADNLPRGAKIVGVDEISGKTLAAQWKTDGGGQVLFLGFRWSHAMREHEAMLRGVLGKLRIKPKVSCSNPNVWVSLRTAGKRSMLFVMNLFSAPMEADVVCRPSWSNKPVQAGRFKLPAMSVRVKELGPGAP
jgi:beta-galactosidase